MPLNKTPVTGRARREPVPVADLPGGRAGALL